MLYEHDNEYILLRVTSKDVVGYYSVYNDSKKMNFSVNDKLINILEHIEEKLEITLADFTLERKGGEHIKATVSDETSFKEDIKPTSILKEGKVISKEGKVIPKEDVMYPCRALLQIQSIFFNMEDNIIYYRQLLSDQCIHKHFIYNPIFHPDLDFTDTESDSKSVEEEVNENTVA